MTDIAERLHISANHHAELGMSDLIVKAYEAVDEIRQLKEQLRVVLGHVEDLRAENERLRLGGKSGKKE